MSNKVINNLHMFLLVTGFLAACGTQIDTETAENYQKDFQKMDWDIKSLRCKIDSVRGAAPVATLDSLMKYTAYRYIVENRATADSLIGANQELLNRAYRAAHKYSNFTVPKRNESLFTDYAELDVVNKIRPIYYSNKRRITRYTRAADEMRPVIPVVRNHFDSVTNRRVSDLQLKMDSLLNQKIALINAYKARGK